MKKKPFFRAIGFTFIVLLFLSPLVFFQNTYRKAVSLQVTPFEPGPIEYVPPGTGSIMPYSEIARPRDYGEKVIYGVYMGKLSLGKALFSTLPDTVIDGRTVIAATFQTSLAHFRDTEKIYSDPGTYLPLQVDRHVFLWPNAEKITELYDQKNHTVTVSKTKGKRQEQVVIKSDKAIYNPVVFPFYLRSTAQFTIGASFILTLPSREFVIRLVSKEEVEVPAGKFVAYKFESTPSQFEIWISDDERHVPLKIKGTGTFGYTLAMREYHQTALGK